MIPQSAPNAQDPHASIHTNGKVVNTADTPVTPIAVTRGNARADTTPRATWRDYVKVLHALDYTFRLNVLSDRVEVNGRPLDDVTEAIMLCELHERGFSSADVARRAITTQASKTKFHPVHEYLQGLTWDGKDHLAALAGYITDNHPPITYADGSSRSVFNAFLRRWLIGAIAKAHDPITGQNPMLVLDGAQGAGKSYLASWICPIQGMHVESSIRPDDKDYLVNLTTKFVWEVGELGSTVRRADRESLKQFLTLGSATYRPPYGRHPVTKPALASCIGTVNLEHGFLTDPTGNRRFWPLTLKSINHAYSSAIDVDQLWAQALVLYQSGERWTLSPEEKATHAQLCELYEVEDPYVDRLLRLFEVVPIADLTDESRRWLMSSAEIRDAMIADGERATNQQAFANAIGSTLRTLGVGSDVIRIGRTKAKRVWVGVRPRAQSLSDPQN